ncbi:MAG TPA: lysophospholipid acyltransferase family protein [Malonomonas sp.]
MTDISLKFRCEYWAVKRVAALVRWLPRELSLAFGGRLGLLAFWLLSKRRKLAEENLRRAFPQFNRKQVAGLARANFIHVGVSSMEMLRMNKFQRGGGDLERYFDISGLEHLREAQQLGRGVIMLTGHFGFWEAGFFVLPELGIDVDAVTKPMKNPLTDRFFNDIRESFGAGTLDSRHGARRILKSLQANRVVGVLLDQHISPPGSVATDFFGRKAYTTTAISNLAMKFQVPVVPVFSRRLPNNRYLAVIEPMLLLQGQGEQAVQENTQLLTNIIETAVREDITQWFWMHKRWRVPEETAAN